MKTLIFLLAAFSVQVVYAGTDVSAASLTKQLNDLNNEYATLKADRAVLARRKDDLDWSATQVENQATKYKADKATYDAKLDSLNARVDSHNSRCSGSFTDKSYVDSCNSEADQLNSEGSQLDNERADLEKTRQLLSEAINTQEEQTKFVYDQDKKDYDRMVEIHNLEVRIIAQLNAIAKQNDKCKDAIAHGSQEEMKAVCGQMFDGNN